jgi:hypothetical protein
MPSSLVQTLCKKYSIWRTIRRGEECEECVELDPRNSGKDNGWEEKKVAKRDVIVRKEKGKGNRGWW